MNKCENLMKIETGGQVPCPDWDEEPVPLSLSPNLRYNMRIMSTVYEGDHG